MQIKSISAQMIILCLCIVTRRTQAQQHKKQKPDSMLAEMQVICQSDSIVLNLYAKMPFNGLIYAKDAPSSNNCVSEYASSTNMTFKLPLKSCGTMFNESDDGIEYFNTIMVQPHMRLMTSQGRGYHIRCKYQTQERTIANTHFNVSASFMMQGSPSVNIPLLATASMPSCTMKIYRSGADDNVAETVKIGDKLYMVIEIDQQDMYGMKITNCVARDGLNMAEQLLINNVGCPVDESIMPKFEYTNNSTRAAVFFSAHKFPHTSSIYYQCNVRLCINNGGCDSVKCERNSIKANRPRAKRSAISEKLESHLTSHPIPGGNNDTFSFDVYSGLYVRDYDIEESNSSDSLIKQVAEIKPRSKNSRRSSYSEYCINFGQTSFKVIALGLAVTGVILILMCQIGMITNPTSRAKHMRETNIARQAWLRA